jgi:hypothetical protein
MLLLCGLPLAAARAQGVPPAESSMPASEGEAVPEEAAPEETESKKSFPAAKTTPTPEEEDDKPVNAVRLQGLNKVTARISTVEALLGTVMRFGNLEIIAKRCWKAPPEDQPENAALFDIWELKSGEEPQKIFSGWMFSSSPALSALEHPVYDITVLACTNLPVENE